MPAPELIAHIDAALEIYASAKAWRGSSTFDRSRFNEQVRTCLSLARALGYADGLDAFETAPLSHVVAALQRARRRAEPPRPVAPAPVVMRPRRPRYRPGFWRRFL
jgi:hypothetical protein